MHHLSALKCCIYELSLGIRREASSASRLAKLASANLAAKAKKALEELEGKKVSPAVSKSILSKAVPATKSISKPAPKKVEPASRSIISAVAADASDAIKELEGKPVANPAKGTAAVLAAQAAVKKAVAAINVVSPPMVSAVEVHKIMNKMMKKHDIKAAAKMAKESKTDRMKDRILRAKNRLASLKLKKSHDFEKYEKTNEKVEHAKSKAQEAHDQYREDVERERSFKTKLNHLQQKLANHLTGKHARTDLNTFYAQLQDKAVKSIPKKIIQAHKLSTEEAQIYKHSMELHHAGARGRDAKMKMDERKTVSLKEVNVWDNDESKKESLVDHAERKLRKVSREADREIMTSEEAKDVKS